MSYNQPVRDELVVNLDGIMPELKSNRGIPVVKHTKRGQSENRRLRLDTDLSTLEVFSTNTGYLNRRMSTRTHNLSLLEEVGPAKSVPGGLPATPGRTLRFVFRNRNLYITVSSRDVGAALVALFRGGASGPAPVVAVSASWRGVEDGADGSARKATSNASPSSPSPARRQERTSRSQSRHAGGLTSSRSSRAFTENRASVGPCSRHSGGRDSNIRGRDKNEGESDYGRMSGRGRAIAKLKRSASYTAGLDDDTSSEDDDSNSMLEIPAQRTPPLSGTSGRSPMSTYSSESPDPIMRARMVGIGSHDVMQGVTKPKRVRPTHSFKTPWARRGGSESDRVRNAAVAAATSSSRHPPVSVFAVEDKATAVPPDLSKSGCDSKKEAGGGGTMSTEGSSGRSLTTSVTQTALPSPIAIATGNSNDLVSEESAAPRRPASAASVVYSPTSELSPALLMKEDFIHVSATKVVPGTSASRTVAPSAGRGSSSKSPASLRRMDNINSSPEVARAIAAAQQQLPPASPLQTVDEVGFDLQLRSGTPRRGSKHKKQSSLPRKEHGDTQPPVAGGERSIPLLQRPIGTDGKTRAMSAEAVDHPSVAAMSRDSTDRSSTSPPQEPRNYAGRENGGGHLLRGRVSRKAVTRVVASSSSFESMDEGDGASGDRESMNSASTSASADSPSEIVTVRGVSQEVRNRRKTSRQMRDSREMKDVTKERRESRQSIARETREPRNVKDSRDSRRARDGRDKNTRLKDLLRTRETTTPGTPGRLLTRPRNKPRASSHGSVSGAAAMAASRVGSSVPRSSHDGSPQLAGDPLARGAEGDTTPDNQRREESAHSNGPLYSPVVAGGPSNKLTIEAGSPHESGPVGLGATLVRDSLPFLSGQGGTLDPQSIRGSLASHGSRGTDCTSPDSPPGGAVGEVRASISSPPPRQPRSIPIISRLQIGGAPQQDESKGPSGFEELWSVLEPAWGINASFGTSMTPKVMLLGEIYETMRDFQAAVASVCVRACGPALGEVCGRCGRAWAVLASASPQAIAEFPALHKIDKGIRLLIAIVTRYETSAVVRRFTLSFIRSDRPVWDEMLNAGEGADLQGPCRQIEEAIALLPVENQDEEVEKSGGGGGRGGSNHLSLGGAGGGRHSNNGRGGIGGWSPGHLWLPPCPSYWAKGQFDRLTPRGLSDVLALLHEPTRFGELARLVTRASDEGPLNRSCSPAWDCVRQAEGPTLGRALRRALSATLVDAGEFLPLPRVPPPPPAYLPRERLTKEIEATILHPFLPLGIAGIGGPSGSGKTVLAAAVVRDEAVRRRFGDRVFWLHAGHGANTRMISMVQALADTVYAWLIDSEKGSQSATGGGGGSRGGGGGGVGGGEGIPDGMREPVRFRDEQQAVQYVADLCQGPRLAGQGLRCLVVVDDVHEEHVVKILWKSQCQLLVISPVPGLLQAVGAEATLAERFPVEDARIVAAAAAEEEALCGEGARLVDLCRGCPLAVAMAGALAQTVLHASPAKSRGGGSGAGKREGETHRRGWSLSGVSNTVNNLAAPVGAWVEQVVGVGGSHDRKDGGSSGGHEPSEVTNHGRAGQGHGRPSVQSIAWTEVAKKVDAALVALESNRGLRKVMDESGAEDEKSARAMQVVLTQVALAEADAILGDSGLATKCYLSFALLPDGFPLPPPALEEFWRPFDPAANGNPRGSANSFATHQEEPRVVEVLEALRLVGRAGGGEGAAGLAPHGLQRRLLLVMARSRKDVMDKLLRRRVWVLSRISSLVGTFDDQCWTLGGGGDAKGCVSAGGGRSRGGKGPRREGWLQVQGEEEAADDGDSIPAGLLGSGPGPPSHGYGGFSRYDYLVASWDALPPSHTLAAAASRYLDSVRVVCRAAHGSSNGSGGCRWAAARALASAADLQALANRGAEAIPAYEEACAVLAAEMAQRSQAGGVSQWQRAARDALHKVARMMQDLALLTSQFRKEAPAMRLLQRAVEIHLSVLASSGGLVPDLGGSLSAETSLLYDPSKSPGPDSIVGADREVQEAAQLLEVSRGRGAGITWKAVANDDRPLPFRLRLQPTEGLGEPIPVGRGGGGGGAGGTLPAFGRLDIVATCVGDLGRIVSCMRQLRLANRVDESVQLAEKVFPVLREILGAEHAFTKAALAGFVGQVIVDECWAQQGGQANGDSPLGLHPTLPSPTSRRKQARNYEGRGGGGVGVGSAEKRSTPNSALSALSSPPSPLPQKFYAPTQSTVAVASGSAIRGGSAFATPHGATKGWPGVGVGAMGHSTEHFSFTAIGSDSSVTEGDDEDDDGLPRTVGALGAGSVRRGAGRVGRGAHPHYLHSKRSLERPLQGWQREAHEAWQRGDAPPLSGSAASALGARAALHPASTLMQHDRYIRHLIRRARAHAFLITAATRARLKDADRAKAGLFLLDMARQASSHVGGAGSGGAGGVVAATSPEGAVAQQMPRLTAAWKR